MFGLDLDPTTEALVIGVLSNMIYDALKTNAHNADDLKGSIPSYNEILKRLGDLERRCQTLVARIWNYGRENMFRFINDLKK